MRNIGVFVKYDSLEVKVRKGTYGLSRHGGRLATQGRTLLQMVIAR